MENLSLIETWAKNTTIRPIPMIIEDGVEEHKYVAFFGLFTFIITAFEFENRMYSL